jgi:hypothetical protein
LQEFADQLSPGSLNVGGEDLKLIDLSNYAAGPGSIESIESARSSGTDLSSSEALSIVPLNHVASIYPKSSASCSSNSQHELVGELICAVSFRFEWNN